MTTRTANTKGLDKPHKAQAAKPGIGSTLSNAKSIATERSPKGPASHCGFAPTAYANSRSIDTQKSKK